MIVIVNSRERYWTLNCARAYTIDEGHAEELAGLYDEGVDSLSPFPAVLHHHPIEITTTPKLPKCHFHHSSRMDYSFTWNLLRIGTRGTRSTKSQDPDRPVRETDVDASVARISAVSKNIW
ncbi:hypothetical protein PSTT_16941 [Puccinia striiformis]|uniref:Uncharacterized protein n=1 Tax=Puccinia striiformis TaxID=27350 RepID=A0A2S4UAG4_9BASI|nr:hypothetical protein PSTT_16941 [Puccinia striiformis]